MAVALLYAAEKAPRDVVVAGAGKAMLLNQRLSPRIMDAIMRPMGYRWRKVDDPKAEGAPDCLYEPTEDDERIEGSLGRGRLPEPLHLARHPPGSQGDTRSCDGPRGRRQPPGIEGGLTGRPRGLPPMTGSPRSRETLGDMPRDTSKNYVHQDPEQAPDQPTRYGESGAFSTIRTGPHGRRVGHRPPDRHARRDGGSGPAR